jgi:tripartite-type tricarboxylate transporter receptor subunit TctC
MVLNPSIRRRTALAALIGLAVTGKAAADPLRAMLRLVVPGAPDSPMDLFVRALAEAIDLSGGRRTLVENRSADQGGRAAGVVENAAPDGRTLLVFGSGLISGRHARDRLAVDPFNRLSVIAQLTQEPLVLAVASDGPAACLPTLREAVRAADPAKAAIGGVDPLSCLVAHEMARRTDLPATPRLHPSCAHLIYEIEAGRVLGGWVRPSLLPAGRRRIKLIAVSSRQRSRLYPDVPTAAEQGAEGLDIACWTGLFGPAGLPMATIEAAWRLVEDAFDYWRLRSTIAALGMEPALRPGEALLETMQAQDALWTAAGPVGDPPRPPRSRPPV